MANLGFIGLGIMGGPMCGQLLKAGHTLRVFDVSREAVARQVARGAAGCASPAEAARGAQVLFTMLPDGHVVERVLFGEQGAAAQLTSEALVADLSSIAAHQAQAFARRLKEQGVAFVDAPVSGGQVGAEQATLSIMAGGDAQAFARLQPYFALLGKNINLVGGSGCGQIAKSANQIIVALSIAAVGEALLFAKTAGADPAAVRQALLGGFAGSRILELHGERMAKRNFVPGGTCAIQSKDTQIALELAQRLNMPLPALGRVQQHYNALLGRPEGGGLDHAAAVLVLETLAAKTL